MGSPIARTNLVTTAERRRTAWPVDFYRSAVGKKWVMAITGIILLGYLVAHLIGNLKIFLPDVDGYPRSTSTPRACVSSCSRSSPTTCCSGSCGSA
jgi:hypothetical protein